MPVEFFIRYKELCYDVGTRLRFKVSLYGGVKEGVIDRFINNHVIIRCDDGELYSFCTTRNLVNFDKEIVEIIDPVYYTPNYIFGQNRKRPPSWDLEIGWIWYIIIMVVGAIFKDRLMIWVCATVYFFLWKNGVINGGKK